MTVRPDQTLPPRRVASRRNVVRGTAWTAAAVTVVVATPNVAAASETGSPPVVVHAQREGANFRLRVKAPTGKTIQSVTIGVVLAQLNQRLGEYTARLPAEATDTQAVLITYTDGSTFTTSINFRP